MTSIFKRASSPVPVSDEQQARATKEDLQSIMLDLARYGQPRVGMYSDRGWHCSIDVCITPIGAKFEARSEFTHATPSEAAIVCRQRLTEAIRSLGGEA